MVHNFQFHNDASGNSSVDCLGLYPDRGQRIYRPFKLNELKTQLQQLGQTFGTTTQQPEANTFQDILNKLKIQLKQLGQSLGNTFQQLGATALTTGSDLLTQALGGGTQLLSAGATPSHSHQMTALLESLPADLLLSNLGQTLTRTSTVLLGASTVLLGELVSTCVDVHNSVQGALSGALQTATGSLNPEQLIRKLN
ncbi:hypothetical protein CHS0354_032866 [Potamilus streckersoni]|uniref:Uncharacterized protein n=1 Tax=Potamilus streckersoni TaxID=2493646 RepID=A0AAE0T1Y2_9BIVA|nr:hypothetical protein CHS0354_032866 [Potamilus streckersoni]